MKKEEIEQQIADLEAVKPHIQANFDRQMNYQLGIVDGRIALLREMLESEAPESEQGDESH